MGTWVYVYMRTAIALIRLCMRAVWPGPSLSVYRTTVNCRIYIANAFIGMGGFLGQSGYKLFAYALKTAFLMTGLNIKLMNQRMTKATIRLVLPAKTQVSLHIHPAWQRLLFIPLWTTWRLKKAHAISGDSDQPARMRRLIWVFAGRTSIVVGFVVRWLSFYYNNRLNQFLVTGKKMQFDPYLNRVIWGRDLSDNLENTVTPDKTDEPNNFLLCLYETYVVGTH